MFGLHFIHGISPILFESNEWEFFIGIALATNSLDTNKLSLPKQVTSE